MFKRHYPARSTVSATVVRRKPSLDFSLTGLVYCSMMVFMGLAAINTQANLLFGIFGLMIGVLLVSGTISRLVLRKLVIRRRLPETAMVGQRATIIYDFINKKSFWPSLSVSLAELDGCDAFMKQPFTYLLHAAAGMTGSVPTEVLPRRRGQYALDHYQISTSFPFSFIKRALIHRHKDAIVIYPALGRVDPKVLSLCRSAEKTGAMIRPRQGGLDEFYGLKEFRTGENPRFIYWRRSARTGVLVAKEMTQVAPPRLVLLVDTHLTERTPQNHALVERAIAIAASLASHALEAGLLVGLSAWSGDVLGVAPNRGKRHRRDLLALLAGLPLNTAYPAQKLLDSSRDLVQKGATAVLVTPRNIEMGLADRLRGGLLVIPAASGRAGRWFQFDPDIDFAHCMPPEQEIKA